MEPTRKLSKPKHLMRDMENYPTPQDEPLEVMAARLGMRLPAPGEGLIAWAMTHETTSENRNTPRGPKLHNYQHRNIPILNVNGPEVMAGLRAPFASTRTPMLDLDLRTISR